MKFLCAYSACSLRHIPTCVYNHLTDGFVILGISVYNKPSDLNPKNPVSITEIYA